MPSTCRSCCCTIRSGQQVLMCVSCCDLVHVRCLPVSVEEADRQALEPAWECVLCLGKRAEREEIHLIALARQLWLNERLDELLARVMALQQEQDEVGKYTKEAAADVDRTTGELEELEATVDSVESESKNSSRLRSEGTRLDPGLLDSSNSLLDRSNSLLDCSISLLDIPDSLFDSPESLPRSPDYSAARIDHASRRRPVDAHKTRHKKMILHNLGSSCSRRTDTHKTQRVPKMSMSLGVLISQLIIMECK